MGYRWGDLHVQLHDILIYTNQLAATLFYDYKPLICFTFWWRKWWWYIANNNNTIIHIFQDPFQKQVLLYVAQNNICSWNLLRLLCWSHIDSRKKHQAPAVMSSQYNTISEIKRTQPSSCHAVITVEWNHFFCQNCMSFRNTWVTTKYIAKLSSSEELCHWKKGVPKTFISTQDSEYFVTRITQCMYKTHIKSTIMLNCSCYFNIFCLNTCVMAFKNTNTSLLYNIWMTICRNLNLFTYIHCRLVLYICSSYMS